MSMARHALVVKDRAFSHKKDNIIKFLEILNLEGHPSHYCTGSGVLAILMNGGILPISGASAMEGLQSTGLTRLVLI